MCVMCGWSGGSTAFGLEVALGRGGRTSMIKYLETSEDGSVSSPMGLSKPPYYEQETRRETSPPPYQKHTPPRSTILTS